MSKVKILVVEDDVNLLAGIRDILELEDYDVLTAEDGLQGLDVLRSQPQLPDLIVSDIMMPRMNGIEFYTEVRKEPRWVTIPFIFLTARGEKADYQQGLRLGVDDYVIKPYDPGDLLVKIEGRIERQRAINEAQKAAITNLKRQILTILNHEFRTPLTFVVAYADMLNNQNPGQMNPDETMQFLRGISAGADRLRRLIENFITLVELQTEDAWQTYNWRKGVVDDMELLLHSAIDKALGADRERQVSVQVSGTIPPFMADTEYLTIAMVQLIGNALKFSEPDTPVLVRAGAAQGEIWVSVEDKGRGIPVTEQENIWESFYQVDRATHEDQGAGAGLAIVQGIARLHNGRVALTSTPEAGSTFTLYLPTDTDNGAV